MGGNSADFDQALPWLKMMGSNIILCGPVGSGQAVKLCNQVLCAGHMVALCEALNLAEAQGLDPNLVVEVCSTGAAGSWALANLGPKIIDSDFAPGFAIEHMVKDLRLVLENLQVAETVSGDRSPFPVTQWANHCFQQVAQAEGGEGRLQGTQAAIRAYREFSKSSESEFSEPKLSELQSSESEFSELQSSDPTNPSQSQRTGGN